MIYRPSLVINFRVRFDEAFFPNAPAPIPYEIDDSFAPAGGSDVLSELPQLMSGTKDDLSYVVGVVPQRANIELAGYRQAGKWSADLPFRDFPFDPRILRSCAAEIHLGCISDADWGEGNTGVPRTGENRRSMLRTRQEGGGIRRDTLLMIGMCDCISVDHNDKGSIVSLSGRDLRCLLLDTPVRPALLTKLKLDVPITQVVQQILSLHPLTAGIRVSYDDWPPPLIPPAPAVKGDLARWRMGAEGQTATMSMAGDPNSLNFWDVITRYCYLVGTIPYFDGEELWIRKARSLYEMVNQSPNEPGYTPFKDHKQREIAGVEGSSFKTAIRVLAYGRDISSFKLERKLQGPGRPVVVEVISTDSNNSVRGLESSLVVARWPDTGSTPQPMMPGRAQSSARAGLMGKNVEKSKATTISPSGEMAMGDVIRIPVHGIRSKERLQQIAKDIYHEIANGEMGGSCSTRDLASLGGDASDPDLLRLRPGDPVRFIVDTRDLRSYPPPVSEFVNFNRQTPAERAAALTKRLGDPKLARALSAAHSGIDRLASIFRVSNVKYTWDVSQGVGVDFDFQNYIEARSADADAKKSPRSPQKHSAVSAPKPPPLPSRTANYDPNSSPGAGGGLG